MTTGTYAIRIASPAGGYEANTLTLTMKDGVPGGLLGDFVGLPLVLREPHLDGDTVVFDTEYITVCGDFRVRLEATTAGAQVSGELSFAMGAFPFNGELTQ